MKKLEKLSTVVALGLIGVSSFALAEQSNSPQPTQEQITHEVQGNTRFLAANALDKAKSLLEYYGDFAPFGVALFPNGQIKYVWAVKPGESLENVSAGLVLNSVRTALGSQAMNGRILGSAVVYKFQPSGEEVPPQVNIELEYFGGYSQVLATRYTKDEDGYQFEDGVFGEFESIVFASNSDRASVQ